MRASEEGVRDSRAGAARLAGGEPEVQRWEMAIMHRVHDAPEGAGTRVTWVESDPTEMDHFLDAVREDAIPKLEQLPGFCSISVLVDRQSSQRAVVTTYESREAMRDAATRATAIREGVAQCRGFRGRQGL